MRHGLGVRRDGQLTQLVVQPTVLEPQEFAQVIAPSCSLMGLGRRDDVARPLGFVADRAMLVTDTLPIGSPVAPFGRRGEDPIEVVDVDPVRDEPRLPMAGGDLNAVRCLDGHRSPRSRRSATADR